MREKEIRVANGYYHIMEVAKEDGESWMVGTFGDASMDSSISDQGAEWNGGAVHLSQKNWVKELCSWKNATPKVMIEITACIIRAVERSEKIFA